MESVLAYLNSAQRRWRAWSRPQRTLLGVAMGVIVLGVMTLGFETEEIRYVPLSLGKQFAPEELASIEQSLHEKNLTSYRTKENQLLVPEEELTVYDSALLQEQQLPRDWASEWEQKFEATNPFTSSRKLKMLKEIALAKELKRIIQGLDGIREANVVWAETETRSWPARQQKVTASVNLRPEEGRQLSEQTIRAIQFSVANMVPNLEAQDVIVLDYSAGRHYQLRPEEARFETDLQRWVDREVSRWQGRLLPALQHHWPGAKLVIQPGQEELRLVARDLLVLDPAGGGRSVNPPSFQDIERTLQQRFPEFIQLTVSLHESDLQAVPENHTGRSSLQEDIYSALIGWLPDSFEAHQLRVELEPAGDERLESQVAGSEAPATSWQPVILVVVSGLCLFLVSRRLRSRETVSDSAAPAAMDSADEALKETVSPRRKEDEFQPAASAQPMTPLGDPEQVADVLKQWLGSSSASSPAQASPQSSQERG